MSPRRTGWYGESLDPSPHRLASELDAVRLNGETPLSHVANAIQVLYAVDPATMSPRQVGELVDAAIGRLMAALRGLEGSGPRLQPLTEDPYNPAPLPALPPEAPGCCGGEVPR